MTSIVTKVLHDPRLYLLYWLSVNDVEVDKEGKFRQSGAFKTILPETIYLDYQQQVLKWYTMTDHRIGPFLIGDLKVAFTELIVKEVATWSEQVSEVKPDSIDLFVHEYKIMKPVIKNKIEWLQVTLTWHTYQKFCAEKGLEPRNQWWLGRILGTKYGVKSKVRQNVRFYRVDPSCKLRSS